MHLQLNMPVNQLSPCASAHTILSPAEPSLPHHLANAYLVSYKPSQVSIPVKPFPAFCLTPIRKFFVFPLLWLKAPCTCHCMATITVHMSNRVFSRVTRTSFPTLETLAQCLTLGSSNKQELTDLLQGQWVDGWKRKGVDW